MRIQAHMLTSVFCSSSRILMFICFNFFLNFYMWRIEFTNETCKKLSYQYFWLWRPQSLTHTVERSSHPWTHFYNQNNVWPAKVSSFKAYNNEEKTCSNVLKKVATQLRIKLSHKPGFYFRRKFCLFKIS